MAHTNEKKKRLGSGIKYDGHRGFKYYRDSNGQVWACHRRVNPGADFAGSGCWMDGSEEFTRND